MRSTKFNAFHSLVLVFGLLVCSTMTAQFALTATSLGSEGEWGQRPTYEDGPELWAWESIMCSGIAGEASSVLAPQGKKTYLASNMGDDDPTTAWVEGKAGNGVGEWIEVDYVMENGVCSIVNGYQSSKSSFTNNGRVKKFAVVFEGKEVGTIQLLDVFGIQTFTIPEKYRNGKLRFVIRDVYPGAKYSDTAISEFWSCGG
jgi:hypothetical protein